MIALTDLEVYQLGERLSDMVWEDYDHWPEKAQRTMGFQIIRSSDSISINLAEGYGRYTPIDELGPKLNAFINSTIKHYGN